MSAKNPKGAVFTGVVAAIAASSCCIPPVIAAIAGAGGASSSMAWMEPYRPYLIVLAILAIGYAWYSHLKPKKEDDCGCDIEKPKWYQSRTFLVGMTLFAALSIGFPYYSGIFYSDNSKNVVVDNKEDLETVEVTIDGMTCDACQNHVDHAVNELNGIVSIKTSYANGTSIIQFDKTKTNQEQIEKAVNSTGYNATKIKVQGKPQLVYVLTIAPIDCRKCLNNIHKNLQSQEGIIEICTDYLSTELAPEDGVARMEVKISFYSEITSIKKVTERLELENEIKVESTEKKKSFYE